ncbi:hypothetical protein BSLG_002866 [Batrachochytrium salamandrivorans]|nr:hypothetical protein BSLG_002866 [Batrachochytrium salamandrivorans]
MTAGQLLVDGYDAAIAMKRMLDSCYIQKRSSTMLSLLLSPSWRQLLMLSVLPVVTAQTLNTTIPTTTGQSMIDAASNLVLGTGGGSPSSSIRPAPAAADSTSSPSARGCSQCNLPSMCINNVCQTPFTSSFFTLPVQKPVLIALGSVKGQSGDNDSIEARSRKGFRTYHGGGATTPATGSHKPIDILSSEPAYTTSAHYPYANGSRGKGPAPLPVNYQRPQDLFHLVEEFGWFHQGYTDKYGVIHGGVFDDEGRFHFGKMGENDPVIVQPGMMAKPDNGQGDESNDVQTLASSNVSKHGFATATRDPYRDMDDYVLPTADRHEKSLHSPTWRGHDHEGGGGGRADLTLGADLTFSAAMESQATDSRGVSILDPSLLSPTYFHPAGLSGPTSLAGIPVYLKHSRDATFDSLAPQVSLREPSMTHGSGGGGGGSGLLGKDMMDEPDGFMNATRGKRTETMNRSLLTQTVGSMDVFQDHSHTGTGNDESLVHADDVR